MKNKQHIFLSYSRADSGFALQLAKDLKDAGLRIWVDQFDIPDGKHWDNTIEEALDNSCALILIISPLSASSDRVKDEVSYAQDNQIHIFPILYKETKLPLSWRRLQFIEINDRNYVEKFEAFAKRIANFVSCQIDMEKINISRRRQKRYLFYTLVFILLGAVAIGSYQAFFSKVHEESIEKESIDTNIVDDQKVLSQNMEKEKIEIVKKVEEKNVTSEKAEKTGLIPNTIQNNEKVIQKTSHEKEKQSVVVKKNVVKNIKEPVEEKKEERRYRTVKTQVKEKNIETPQTVVVKERVPQKVVKENIRILPKLPSTDSYASLFDRYERLLQRDKNTQLIIISHTNSQNAYDEAQQRAYETSLALRDRGLKRSMIVTKVISDGQNRISFDFRRQID